MLKRTILTRDFNLHFDSLKIFLGLFLTLVCTISYGQSKSNKGKEFWIGFMSHIEDTDAGMSLYITSDSNTSGTVSVPGQSWSTTFTVTANNLTVVNVPPSKAYINCSDCIQNKGVKVVSGKDVVVFAHHYEGNKSDATLVLPTRTQGKEYYLMSYQEITSNFGQTGKNTFSVVATKDSTKINLYTVNK